MNISKIIYRLSFLNPGVEFLSILTWMLFFPMRDSKDMAYIYFLGLAILIILFSIRNFLVLKNVEISGYTLFLVFMNLVIIISVIFSVYHFRSIASYADIFLVSFYAALFFLDKTKKDRYYHCLLYMVSIFSLLEIIHNIATTEKGSLFFSNPILQGVVSGIGVLIALFFLLAGKEQSQATAGKKGLVGFLQEIDVTFFILLLINCSGVYVSRSKAAFIGILCFALFLVALKKKILIPILVVAAIITFLVPNPVRDSFIYSITKDPYALDRPKIWKVSVDIFKDYPLTGVGLDNFAEVSKKYNFKQTKGLANYYKVPQQAHNDYLKFIGETGLPGLLLLAVSLFIIARKIFASSLFNITKILILYLLFQAFLFNIIFRAFFLFLLLFLLKILFEKDQAFTSLSRTIKVAGSSLLIFFFLTCYFLPLLANFSLEKAGESSNAKEVKGLLDRAVYFNPLNIEYYFMRAEYFFELFQQTKHLEYFHSTLQDVKKIQQLNAHFTGSYILESSLYHFIFKSFESSGTENYVSLAEIIKPLTEAETFSPYDPFIKMHKAQAYLDFDELEAAKQAAIQAIELEPQYVAALYFLHKNFDYFGGEQNFNERLTKIIERSKHWNLQPGTYLYELVKIPTS